MGPLEALTIGVGTMIGAGIFVLPGPASDIAGPAVAVSFAIGGVIALLTAMSASELGTAMPKAGGGYYFINHALGPLFGSIAGWGNWIGLAFASAFYALGFGSYVSVFFEVPSLPLGFLTLTGKQLAALGAGVLFIGVNYIGAKETGRLQNIIVIILIGILAVFTVAGLGHANLDTLTPLAPRGWGAVFPATALVFVSFMGFAQITTVAEEIKNPGRNLPLAIIGSVVLVTVIYVGVMIVLTSVIPWDELGGKGDIAVVEVATIALGSIGAFVLTLGGLLATASSANASILASSRINFAMGRDRLVSNWLNEIHAKFKTPHRSIGMTGALILAFIFIGDVELLAKAGSVLHLVVYGLLNVALLVMRKSGDPDYKPSYRVPFYPALPIVGALTAFGLIAFMEPLEIGLAGACVGGGAIWYFIYARRTTDKSGVLSRFILRKSEAVPEQAVEAAKLVQPDSARFRVMVPLANPATEYNLISLASSIAHPRDGEVVAVHIVRVPDQLSLEAGAERLDEIAAESEMLLDKARRDAETLGVDLQTHTIVSHRIYEEIFNAARNHHADVVLLGWGDDSHGSPGRVESALGDIAGELPCDFVVFKDRGFEPERVLVPTAGGPDSDVSAQLARDLQSEFGSQVSLLHVVDGADQEAEGRAFLEDWGAERELGDADFLVDTSGDILTAVKSAALDHTLLIIGATERGLLERLTRGSVTLDIIDQVDCSVLLAEKAFDRSLRERLFGHK